jgi:Glycoside Hydrolase Family 113
MSGPDQTGGMKGGATGARPQLRRRQLTVAFAVLGLLVLVGSGLLYASIDWHGGKLGALLRTHGPAPAPTATPAPPTPTPIPFARPTLQAGVAFPHWNTTAYGAQDSSWQAGVKQLQSQTGARWVSVVVTLYMDTPTSLAVHAGAGTPTPQSLEAGVLYAHELGLRVFVEPLLSVLSGDPWGGWVHFTDPTQTQAWFDSYWAAYQPYVHAATAVRAEQIGMATELDAMELGAPASDWNQLISRIRGVYHGALTYDLNWSEVTRRPVPAWMSNPGLDYIGISEYQDVTSQPQTLRVDQLLQIWQSKLLPSLDRLSSAVGKPLLFTEIGYRNATDALYQPWRDSTTAPPDPQLQATAYQAAAEAAFGDPHIEGLYFWAWDNGVYTPSTAALQALHALYLSPDA